MCFVLLAKAQAQAQAQAKAQAQALAQQQQQAKQVQDAMAARIQGLEQSLKLMAEKVVAQDQSNNQLAAALQNQQQQKQQEENAYTTALSSLKANMEKLEGKLSALPNPADIAAQTSKNSAQLQEQSSTSNLLTSSVEKLNNMVNGLGSRLNSVENNILHPPQADDSGEKSTLVKALGTSLGNLQEAVTALSGKVDSLEKGTESLKVNGNGALAKDAESTAALAASVGKLEGVMTNLADKVRDLGEKERQSVSLKDNYDKALNAEKIKSNAQLEETMRGLGEKLGDLGGKINAAAEGQNNGAADGVDAAAAAAAAANQAANNDAMIKANAEVLANQAKLADQMNGMQSAVTRLTDTLSFIKSSRPSSAPPPQVIVTSGQPVVTSGQPAVQAQAQPSVQAQAQPSVQAQAQPSVQAQAQPNPAIALVAGQILRNAANTFKNIASAGSMNAGALNPMVGNLIGNSGAGATGGGLGLGGSTALGGSVGPGVNTGLGGSLAPEGLGSNGGESPYASIEETTLKHPHEQHNEEEKRTVIMNGPPVLRIVNGTNKINRSLPNNSNGTKHNSPKRTWKVQLKRDKNKGFHKTLPHKIHANTTTPQENSTKRGIADNGLQKELTKLYSERLTSDSNYGKTGRYLVFLLFFVPISSFLQRKNPEIPDVYPDQLEIH